VGWLGQGSAWDGGGIVGEQHLECCNWGNPDRGYEVDVAIKIKWKFGIGKFLLKKNYSVFWWN